MDKRILESIVALTENQDIDSLELSLLTSVVELLFCTKATIYEVDLLDENKVATALSVIKSADTGEYKWINNAPVADITPELLKAMQQHSKTRVDESNGKVSLWLPISGGNKQVCLHIECQNLKPQQYHFVEAIVKIYSNYLRILVESERDKLTGLLNRHSFDRRLKQILRRQRQLQDLNTQDPNTTRRHVEDKSAWLVMVDIDHFKKVNDQFGHVCGDEVLLSLAQMMRGYFRQSDVMFRFGGEEFVLILAPSSQHDAQQKLEEFREAVGQATFPLAEKMTISAGYTAITDEFQQILIERADKALYYGKDNGRNQVHCYEVLLADSKLNDKSVEYRQSIDLF
ncbi:MAG: GGDEF domain-containing protein [Aestuariibacter sp.]